MRVKESVIFIPELEEASPKYRPWSAHDEEVLRKYYGKTDMIKLANHLNRTVQAIQCKASQLGIIFKLS